MCNLLSYDNHIVTKFFNSLIFTSSTKNLYYRHIFAKTKINFRESTKQKYLYDKPSLQLATASAAPHLPNPIRKFSRALPSGYIERED